MNNFNSTDNKIITRSVKDTSLYYSFDKDELYFSEKQSCLVSKSRKLNINTILRYIASDNLVSQAPFCSIFDGVGRIPPGTETTFESLRAIHKPINYIINNSNSKLLIDHFKFPDCNASLLFSGGLDSSLFLAANPSVKHLYHLNYHGSGSRTNHIARSVAKFFSKELIEINPDYNNFSINDYLVCLSKGITGIQSPSQYCFNISLKNKIFNPDVEYLVSGQNCDTMLYVDHLHSPTQLILHERLKQMFNGFFARNKIWNDSTHTDLNNTMVALSEHLGPSTEFQNYIIKNYKEQFIEQYSKLELPDMSVLSALKLIRWYRGSASVNDNFDILRHQTGIKRIAGLHYTDFLPTAVKLKPSILNLFFCKVEVAKLFKNTAGVDHRDLVTWGILKNLRELSNSKNNRIETALQMSRFNNKIIMDLLAVRKDSIIDLLDEIGISFLNNKFKNILAKGILNPEDFSIIHRLINIDVYIRALRV